MRDHLFINPSESDAVKNESCDEDVSLNCLIPRDDIKPKRPSDLRLQIPKEKVSDEQSTSSRSSGAWVKKHDLEFKDLSYTVKTGFIKRQKKCILQNINGSFMGGELTAVMGPSGAGKSTLLNILSGYILHRVTGSIRVNGHPRDIKKFKSQIAYITQDTELQPHLTVSEAMYFSANLKIGKSVSKAEKKEIVKKILDAIGMYETRFTRTGSLSGGQKKRLSIALELVCNPPILVLDEPTSGLDSSTSTQCVSLLKKLAEEGRTIICTIHQPSALVFGMFDHVYALAEGRCIYAGGTRNLVSFLAELNLNCPESYSPSDYLLEISTNDYGYENHRLVEKIQNGSCTLYRKSNEDTTVQKELMARVERMMECGLITPVKAPPRMMMATTAKTAKLNPILESSSVWGSTVSACVTPNENPVIVGTNNDCVNKPKMPSIQIDPSKLCQLNQRYATPFHRQLMLLLMRTFLILWRDRTMTTMRIFVHAAMGLVIGILYYGIGNDAAHALNNFRYIFFSIMFVMYTAFSSIILNFPLEFPIVCREHFNRWYSFRAYYLALTLADIPIQLLCTSSFVVCSYFLTKQPFEVVRLSLFFVMVVMSSLVAQSIGHTIGAIFSVKNGAIFGPFFICPFLIFSGFFIQLKDVNENMQWLFHISFLKYSLEGSVLAIFGYDRPRMVCDQIFCQFVRPITFLKVVGMEDGSYEFCVGALLMIFLILRIISFYIMSLRLKLFR